MQEPNAKKDDLIFDGDETFNLLQILEDGVAEDFDEVIKFEQIPKHQLKKCRKCNFKRRTCVVNITMCKANQKRCVSCQKAGHYPQSLNCKVRRKSIKKCATQISSNFSRK